MDEIDTSGKLVEVSSFALPHAPRPTESLPNQPPTNHTTSAVATVEDPIGPARSNEQGEAKGPNRGGAADNPRNDARGVVGDGALLVEVALSWADRLRSVADAPTIELLAGLDAAARTGEASSAASGSVLQPAAMTVDPPACSGVTTSAHSTGVPAELVSGAASEPAQRDAGEIGGQREPASAAVGWSEGGGGEAVLY